MATEQTQDDTVLTDDTLVSMSDDEIANLDLGYVPAEPDAEPSESEATDNEPDAGEARADGEEEGDETDPADTNETDDADDDAAGETGTEGEPADTDEPAVGEADGSESDDGVEKDADNKTDEETDKDSEEVDYKAAYEKLFTPFKANGKEIKIDSVDDAIQLMQMGANYNKKMAALKPNLKLLKLLENNNLLEPEKLSYLIDLEKKNPDAIKKLIKDSGLDPLEIDTEKESEYQPQTYTVDDREIELDAVLDRIQDTPTYSQTISLVSNKWDGPSKQIVADQPQLLEVINSHMQSGVYDRISTEVEKQRMLGRLNGLSDLEAYRTVGDELDAKGAFNDLFQAEPATQEEPQQKTVVKTPKPEDPKRKSKKRAASSTRTAPKASGTSADFNPLALSDDDFDKLINEKLM